MPLQIFDYSKAQLHAPDYEGLRNLIPNVAAGYKMSRLPEEQAQAEKKARLENALKEVDVEFARPKAQQELATGSEDLETKRLANAIAREYGIPEKEAEIALKQAQAEKASREAANPGSHLQGHARNISDLQTLLNDPRVDQKYKDLAIKLFETDIAKGESLVGTRNQNMQYKPWNALTTDDQAKITGQYYALGINAQDGLELWTHRITPDQIHAMRNQNPGMDNIQAVKAIVDQRRAANIQPMGGSSTNPEAQTMEGRPDTYQPPTQLPGIAGEAPQIQQMAQPQEEQPQVPQIAPIDTRTLPIQPAMTGQNRSDYNTNAANSAEADYLGNWVTEHNAPYSQFPTAKDAYTSLFKRNDKEAQRERHEFLAAQMMGPETALLNIKLAQGSTAEKAIKDVEDRLKLNAKTLGITMTPADYQAATQIMREVLHKGAKIRNQALAGQIDPNSMQTAIKNSKEGKNTVTRIVNGKRYEIPEHLVKQFDEEHK